MSDVTRIIEAVAAGKASATDDLLPLVYDDLKRIAGSRFQGESTDHTLQPTALVHEAYMRLVGSKSDCWENRSHFFSAATEAMRRILIDHARGKNRLKRGGGARKFPLDPDFSEDPSSDSQQLLMLDQAISELELLDKQKADLVKLKFFGGMNLHEAGKVLGLSPRTSDRYWAYSRAWLQRNVHEQIDGE